MHTMTGDVIEKGQKTFFTLSVLKSSRSYPNYSIQQALPDRARSCIERLGSREPQCRGLEAVLINTSDSGARQGTAVRAQTRS